LEVEGSIDLQGDRDALCHRKLEKEFRLTKWNALRKSEQERVTVEQVLLAPEEFGQYLRQAHDAKFPPAEREAAKTAQAAAQTKTNNKTRKGAETLVKVAEAPVTVEMQSTMERDLYPGIEISPDDYRTLAMARAYRVKAFLAETGKVEQDRLFLMADAAATSTNGSRVYLHLK
jgi:hypothetical protein